MANVTIACNRWYSRNVEASVALKIGADTAWALLRDYETILVALPWIDECEPVEGGVSLSTTLSSTLGLRASMTLAMEVDDAGMRISMRTTQCDKFGMDASYTVEGDGESCTVTHKGSFYNFPRYIPGVLVDMKLHSITTSSLYALGLYVDAKESNARIRNELNECFPRMLEETLDLVEPSEGVRERVVGMADHCVMGGKMQRAVLLRKTLEALGSVEDEDEVNACAWSAEVYQGFALVIDDVMDDSQVRRGKQSWWKVATKEVAINDGILLEHIGLQLIHTYVREDVRLKVLHILNRVAYYTVHGQQLDVLGEQLKTEEFSEDTYAEIIKYKTAFYTFYSSIGVGIVLARLPAAEEREALIYAEQLSLKLGDAFQRNDDFLDVFGDPEVTGKVGTDILEGKLTWLILEGLKSDRRERLLEIYGTAEGVPEVKQIFEELDLRGKYARDQAEAEAEVRALIAASPFKKLNTLALAVLKAATKRSK